jgi:hypothetical protein
LHPIEHAQSCIDTGLGRFPITADNAKLRVAAAQEEASAALGTIILIVIVMPHHRTATAIPVAIPTVAALTPSSTVEIITISR